MSSRHVPLRLLASASVALAVAGCGEPIDPVTPAEAPVAASVAPQLVSLCKSGPEGSWATFRVTATLGQLVEVSDVTITNVRPPGSTPVSCKTIWHSYASGDVILTVTETESSLGSVFDGIEVHNNPYEINLKYQAVTVWVRAQQGAILFKNRAAPATGRIGDFVWHDLDEDGSNDDPEPGIAGVPVSLWRSGVMVASTTTSTTGGYSFTNLENACYEVRVVAPSGMAPSLPGADDRSHDSSLSPAQVCAPNEDSLWTDFGFVSSWSGDGKIGDFVWNDLDQDGLQDSGPEGVPEKGEELGIAGVEVTLLRGPITVATTTTSATGRYLFTGLAAGCYDVVVGTPSGLAPSPPGAGPDETNSSSSPTRVCLPTGQTENLKIDFGFAPINGKIGGLAWHDLDRDGIQDIGEPRLMGVDIELWRDGIRVTGGATGTEDSYGNYLFERRNGYLVAGCYQVTARTPTGMTPSPTGAGNPETDSNGSPATVCLPTDRSEDYTTDFGFFWPRPGATGDRPSPRPDGE
jgi:hypothetical protein